MTSESEAVRDLLGSITGVQFRIEQPKENRLLLRTRAVWFVWATSIMRSNLIGSLKAAWKDREGNIWLETSQIADMVELVERYYGEKGAASMPDIKPGVAPTERIPEEVMGYPRVVKLLRNYEDIVAQLSKKRGVELKIIYDGGVGVTTVRIGARMRITSDGKKDLRENVEATAMVLKEARDAVLEAET